MTPISADLVERLGRLPSPVAVSELAFDDLSTVEEALAVLGHLDAGVSHDASAVAEALVELKGSSGFASDQVLEPAVVVLLITLVTTAVIEASTAGAANAETVATVTTTSKVLRYGSRGDWVRYLQDCLLAAGFDVGPTGADGIFGSNTRAAVRAFQESRGLDVDGVVGKETWGRIEAEGGATSRWDGEIVRDVEVPEAPSDLPDVHLTHDELAHTIHASLEGQHYIAHATEAMSLVSQAAAGGETVVTVMAEAMGPGGWIAFMAIVTIEIVEAFQTSERIQHQAGFCYGLMWRALDMPDAYPQFSDRFDQEAWERGVREGRAQASDTQVRNHILLRVAWDKHWRGEGAEAVVLNEFWNRYHEENPVLRDSVLPWPAPRYPGDYSYDPEGRMDRSEDELAGKPPPMDKVVNVGAVNVNNQTLLEEAPVGTTVPYWVVGDFLVIGERHDPWVYRSIEARPYWGGYITVTRSMYNPTSGDFEGGAVTVTGCQDFAVLRRAWPVTEQVITPI